MLLANTSQPGRYLGVECLNHKTALTKDFLNGADAVVVANEACGRALRELGVVRPLALWTHHTDDQPSIEALEFTRERKAWTGFAFVSQWQLDQYAQVFWLPRERARVMRNAIAPAFSGIPPADHCVAAAIRASCTASSASAKSPCRLATAPRTCGASSRSS